MMIRDYSPARLTCPNCLNPVFNPHPDQAVARPTALKQHRRVIPVQEEVEHDLAGTWITLLILVGLMLAATVISLTQGIQWLGVMLLLATLGVGIVAFVQKINFSTALRSDRD